MSRPLYGLLWYLGTGRCFNQQRLSWSISHIVVSSPPTPSPLQVDRLLLREVSWGHRLCCGVISLVVPSPGVCTDLDLKGTCPNLT